MVEELPSSTGAQTAGPFGRVLKVITLMAAILSLIQAMIIHSGVADATMTVSIMS